MSDLAASRNLISSHLNDQFSPGKIDKVEATDIKENFIKHGETTETNKAIISDLLETGKVEKGAVPVLQGILDAPVNNLQTKIDQLTNAAVTDIKASVDFGWYGGFNNDDTFYGAENAGEASKVAENYLNQMKSLPDNNPNLVKIIDAALQSGNAIKDDDQKLDGYIKVIKTIRRDFGSGSVMDAQLINKMANGALESIYASARSRNATINQDGTVNISSQSFKDNVKSHLISIRNAAPGDSEVHKMAQASLNAGYNAGSYQSEANTFIKTIQIIARQSGGLQEANVESGNYNKGHINNMVNNSLDAIYASTRSKGGTVRADGLITGTSSSTLTHNIWSHLVSVRDAVPFGSEVYDLAETGRKAAYYEGNNLAKMNTMIKTLQNIAKLTGGQNDERSTVIPAGSASEIKIETTVKINQDQ